MEKEEYPREGGRAQRIVTPSALVFTLTPEHRRQAGECLRNSGEIRITFREISVTSLTDVREIDSMVID
jgi:hypothetical protein